MSEVISPVNQTGLLGMIDLSAQLDGVYQVLLRSLDGASKVFEDRTYVSKGKFRYAYKAEPSLYALDVRAVTELSNGNLLIGQKSISG